MIRLAPSYFLAGSTALVVALLLPACFPDLTGAPCGSTTQDVCPSGQVCVLGKCALRSGGETSDGGGSGDAGGGTGSGDAGGGTGSLDSGTGGGTGSDGGKPIDAGPGYDAGPAPFDAGVGEGASGGCFDGLDNDNDTLTDCADPDCVAQTCRAPIGECDVLEVCVAGSTTCPEDKFALSTASCGPASGCSTGAIQPQSTCSGAGSCTVQPMTSCNGYACSSATECRSNCGGDNDCVSTHYCSGNTCLPKSAAGGACTAGNQCGTGFCADQRCCLTACTGDCESCANDTGTCGKAAPATDPRNKCGLYTCNAEGACSTTCSPTTCGGDTCEAAATCVASACVSKQGDGTACTDACQCASGVCSAYYTDGDGDSYGAGAVVARACGTLARTGEARNDNDCDDAEKSVYPSAPEVIGNGVDEDCDKLELCYRDDDVDLYRSSSTTDTISTINFKCDDKGQASAQVAPELCDSDENANPGISKPQSKPNGCGNFDFNSDGVETPYLTSIFSCTITCTPGWGSSRKAPECGQEGNWLSCTGGCGFSTALRTMPCL